MSAFIVSTDCMDRVVDAIKKFHRGAFDGLAVDAAEFGTQIGRKLYDLNVEAVNCRYGEAVEPPCYHYSPTSPEKIVAYKAIRCLLYQCSEGDIDERPLFKELARFSDQLAHKIAWEHPQWENAPWD
jgi:hypothetical protein